MLTSRHLTALKLFCCCCAHLEKVYVVVSYDLSLIFVLLENGVPRSAYLPVCPVPAKHGCPGPIQWCQIQENQSGSADESCPKVRSSDVIWNSLF